MAFLRLINIFVFLLLLNEACSNKEIKKQDFHLPDIETIIIPNAWIYDFASPAIAKSIFYINGQGIRNTDAIFIQYDKQKTVADSSVVIIKIETNGAWVELPKDIENEDFVIVLKRNQFRQILGKVRNRHFVPLPPLKVSLG